MGPAHPESPRRTDVITDMLMTLRVLDMLAQIDAPAVTREQLLRVHTAAYIEHLEQIVPQNGYRDIDLDTRMNSRTLQAARFAAGSAVLAVDLVATGKAKNAFCNVRPPGHHATADTAMGFCFFNNVAVAAAHAVEVHGMERVAVIDFDVHHGNGTDEIFQGDQRMRLFSLYEEGLYPLEGGRQAEGDGVYIPMAPGSGGDALRAGVEERWLPALNEFSPQVVFVSAGYDAHVQDEMSSLNFTDADYEWLSDMVMDVANRHAGDRIVSVLEGGYDLESLARCAAAHIRRLADL